MRTNKLFFLISILLLSVALISCKDKDDDQAGNEPPVNNPGTTEQSKFSTPTNLKLEGSLLSWDKVANVTKYRIELVKEGVSMKRMVEDNKVDLTTLNLNDGTYIINVQAYSSDENKCSDYTTTNIEYVHENNKVSIFIEDTLQDSLYIKWMGRTNYSSLTKRQMLYHTASGFEVKFIGSSVTAKIFATNYNVENYTPFVTIVLDDDFENQRRVELTKEITELVLVENITDGKTHKVALYKSTEAQDNVIGIESISTTGKFIPDVDVKKYKIEFIGDSGSCGFGNLSTPYGNLYSSEISDGLKSFASLTGIALNADFQIFAASGWGVKASIYTNPNTVNIYDRYSYLSVNGSGSTIKYNFGSFMPDLVVINLGTNDFSYIKAGETVSTVEYQKRLNDYKVQYKALVKFVHELYPDAHIIMLHGLMNEGKVIADATNEMYAELKLEISNLSTIEINGDGRGASNHPSAASHQEISNKLVEHIKTTLGWE